MNALLRSVCFIPFFFFFSLGIIAESRDTKVVSMPGKHKHVLLPGISLSFTGMDFTSATHQSQAPLIHSWRGRQGGGAGGGGVISTNNKHYVPQHKHL